MSKLIRSISVAGSAVLVLAAVVGAVAAPSSMFDGKPGAPEPFVTGSVDAGIAWDVQYHQRDNYAWQSPIPVNAQHGPACEGPTVTHAVSSFEGLVFRCNEHLMTSIDGGEYGMIYLTPNQVIDWSSGTAVVEWDMSTFRSSSRDWMDIWVTPFEDNLVWPLDPEIPDAQGHPRNAIHIRMDGSGSDGPRDGAFRINVAIAGAGFTSTATWNPYNRFLTPDSARRDRFRLEISQSKITLSMPGYNQVLQQSLPGLQLPFTSGIVQFGHHSYNPYKEGGTNKPGTWHWDNFSLSPATPFTMIPGDRRTVDGTSTQTVNFAAPAPANSFLRFSAQGRVEINTGSGWQVAPRQWASLKNPYTFSNYFVPIAKGAQSIQVRLSADGNLPPPYQAKGFSIWSQSTPGAVSAPPNTPTATATVKAPTATPTSAPKIIATATPSPAPQFTATPSPTPKFTATPTTPPATNTPTATATQPPPTNTPTAVTTAPPTSTPKATGQKPLWCVFFPRLCR